MTINAAAPMYRSRAFRSARAVLIWSEKRLPRPVYTAMYRAAFRVYRGALEARYRQEQRRRVRSGDVEGTKVAAAVTKALPYSLVGPAGLEATYSAVADVVKAGVPGSIVECGVAQGGSAATMALALKDLNESRHIWLFDSYEGLPDPTADDYDPSGATGAHIRPLPKGSCLGTYDEVDELMRDVVGLAPTDYTLVKGWFQDTVATAAASVGGVAVLRLDGDWYESTMSCLEGVYDNLVPGGRLIIDDYHSCFGAYRAVHEFLATRGDADPRFVDDGSGGVIYVKP